jgi:hypothetical protein
MLNFMGAHRGARARCSAMARLAAVGLAAILLAGCASATSTLSSLPKEVGGLPAGTPERSTQQLAYPAVHDMPPPRATAVLTPEQVKAAEAELTAVREGQPKGSAAPKKDRKKQEN